MSDYLSKYQGEEIDERLERVDYLVPKSVIVNDFDHAEPDHVGSASLTHQLKVLVDELFERFVTNDTNQTIQGQKTFGDHAVFSSGLTVPSGQTVTITTDPIDIRGAVAKEYMDKRAVDTNVAGRGLKFIAGAGNTANSIEIELDAACGLKFHDATAAARLRVDINGTVEAGFANSTDELLMWSIADGALRKIKKSALLGDLTKSLRIRGNWNPVTNVVTGDALNGSLTKGSSPIAANGDTTQGYQYFVNADGQFDLVDDNTPEEFHIGDSVVWSGTAWVLLRDQSKVVAFTGKQGTSRQGNVTAAYGDYSADMVTYSRPSGKTDVQENSTDLFLAINDLDDKKVSRTNASFYGTTLFPSGSKTALSYTFSGDPTSGMYFDSAAGMVMTSGGADIVAITASGAVANPNMKFSVNGKGYLTDVNESGIFSTLLASLGELRLRGSLVRFRGLDDLDFMSANSGGVLLRASDTDILNVTTNTIRAYKPIVAPVGVVGTPSYTFTGYATTGLWCNGGALSTSVLGVEITRHVSAGLLMKKPLLMGTADADAQLISFVADAQAPRDAVNLQQMTAAVNATYRPDATLTAITVSTAAQVFDITAADGAKYLVSAKTPAGVRQISEFLVTHDGTDLYVSEYGQVGADVMTVAFVLSGNNCIMNVAPVTGAIDVKVKTIALM
uniref:Tail fiber protein n=1 Tax=Pseudomonas phage Cygsa01 TaxID=3138529 RepID=A0AAU6W4D1_9VIRU